MALRRIKDRWHNSTPDAVDRDVLSEKSLTDHASALAFIIWRQGLNAAINLHAEEFRYDDDYQRVGVISELLAFQIQHADRLAAGFLDQQARAVFIQAISERVAGQMQDNLIDIAGPGDYRPPFIKLLNQRFSDYASFSYDGENPRYDVLRYLGHAVLEVMGEDQTNRWVIDQIIDIDALDLSDQVAKSLHRLFGHSS